MLQATNMLCISCANIEDEIERLVFLVETCVDATFTRCGAFYVPASEIALPMNKYFICLTYCNDI